MQVHVICDAPIIPTVETTPVMIDRQTMTLYRPIYLFIVLFSQADAWEPVYINEHNITLLSGPYTYITWWQYELLSMPSIEDAALW